MQQIGRLVVIPNEFMVIPAVGAIANCRVLWGRVTQDSVLRVPQINAETPVHLLSHRRQDVPEVAAPANCVVGVQVPHFYRHGHEIEVWLP